MKTENHSQRVTNKKICWFEKKVKPLDTGSVETKEYLVTYEMMMDKIHCEVKNINGEKNHYKIYNSLIR